ncbi:MAG: hypothetical protein PHQ19_00795 [Candidatus Krumholzibacteria bacterium]|nr:hypothetical protein [Candidatus Krumholzibacteria bacterium]
MRRSLIGTILLLVVVGSAAAAQGPALTGEMAASKIVVDKEKGEIALPADQVYPSDTVEYTLRYSNSGTAQAAGVSLLGPIPDGTIYIEETATDLQGAHPLFSIDGGKNWQEAPVMIKVVRLDGTVETRKADPALITHIKWSLDGPLEVGGEIMASYRVQVK